MEIELVERQLKVMADIYRLKILTYLRKIDVSVDGIKNHGHLIKLIALKTRINRIIK